MNAGPHPRWRGIKKQSTPHAWWARWETQIHIVYGKMMRGWTLIRLYKLPQHHAITRHYARIWTPKPQDRGRGAEGGIEFIIQKPDYDGGSGEKAAVESQKWENWPPRVLEYGYKCRGVCLKNCHDQEQHSTEKKREFMEFWFPSTFSVEGNEIEISTTAELHIILAWNSQKKIKHPKHTSWDFVSRW